jgi:ATP-dependent DNA ligase
MLANVYSEFHPGWVSPKLDGLRAVLTWDDRCVVYSRKLSEYPPLSAICEEVAHLLRDKPDLYLDGEMYCHGYPLQKIASAVKKESSQPELASKIIYNVYDCFTARDNTIVPQTFTQRLELLRELFRQYGIGIRVKLVPQTYVKTKAELDNIYEMHLKDGYEGSMLRLDGVPYDSRANDYHSPNLLKIKPRFDAEFEVVGWALAETGKANGALMMQFKTSSGVEFWATPALPIAKRMELGKKMPAVFDREWKGKMITVYYAGLSVDGVPLQPTTKLQGRED